MTFVYERLEAKLFKERKIPANPERGDFGEFFGWVILAGGSRDCWFAGFPEKIGLNAVFCVRDIL